jgi:hypothetical protein
LRSCASARRSSGRLPLKQDLEGTFVANLLAGCRRKSGRSSLVLHGVENRARAVERQLAGLVLRQLVQCAGGHSVGFGAFLGE